MLNVSVKLLLVAVIMGAGSLTHSTGRVSGAGSLTHSTGRVSGAEMSLAEPREGVFRKEIAERDRIIEDLKRQLERARLELLDADKALAMRKDEVELLNDTLVNLSGDIKEKAVELQALANEKMRQNAENADNAGWITGIWNSLTGRNALGDLRNIEKDLALEAEKQQLALSDATSPQTAGASSSSTSPGDRVKIEELDPESVSGDPGSHPRQA